MRSINLIPMQRQLRRRVRLRLRLWATALLGAAALMVVACGLLRARVPVVRATDAELAKVAAELGNLNTRLAAASKVATARELNQNTVILLKGQPDWSLLLELLASQTDEQTVLREIRLTPVARPPTPPAITSPGKTPGPRQIDLPSRFKLELRGLCRSPAAVSRFVERMEKLPVMSDVKLLRTSREPFLSGVAANFDIECMLGEMRGAK